MICHQERLVNKKATPDNYHSAITKKKQITARWQTINGKLVCKWYRLDH